MLSVEFGWEIWFERFWHCLMFAGACWASLKVTLGALGWLVHIDGDKY